MAFTLLLSSTPPRGSSLALMRVVIWSFYRGDTFLFAKEINIPPDIHEVKQSG
jgi:hypothetical protein